MLLQFYFKKIWLPKQVRETFHTNFEVFSVQDSDGKINHCKNQRLKHHEPTGR